MYGYAHYGRYASASSVVACRNVPVVQQNQGRGTENMSDTPRADSVWNDPFSYREEGDLESALYALAQELERELAKAIEAMKKDRAVHGIDCAASEVLGEWGL